jgi:DNA-binding transcriptional LysR family regulator
MLTGLREGQFDLALMIQPGKPSLSAFTFEELCRNGGRVAVPPFHALAEARQVDQPRNNSWATPASTIRSIIDFWPRCRPRWGPPLPWKSMRVPPA